MEDNFDQAFAQLRELFQPYLKDLKVAKETASTYDVMSRLPSPFPQHKGKPMWVGQVRKGKAYVSFHLTPLYMNPKLQSMVSPRLKTRMQGKACFNFKSGLEPGIEDDLRLLVREAIETWAGMKYL